MARQAITDERGSVHGVNPGAELGRYTVGTRIETIPGGERWTARDTTLERDVALLVMPAKKLSTAAALDAARRAAGVDTAQLVRILDVGTEGDWSFIAEDLVSGARTLTEIIGKDGLPAEEVRRITGEVATGIEAARTRGLHHLALTPDSVLLTQDGRVKVRGLATSAALAGTETEGEDADRDDATAVVALAYAGLTATWPLKNTTGLPRALHDKDGPPPPSRVAVGVPGDLDTICRETLAEGAGPDSPGDYAAQIAPWSRIPLAGAVRTTPESQQAATDLSEQGRRSEDSEGEVTSAGATAGTMAGAAAAPSTGGITSETEDETRQINLREEGSPTQVLPVTKARQASAADAHRDDEKANDADDENDDENESPAARRAASAGAAAAAAAEAVGTGGKVLGERLGKAAKSARGRSQDAIQDARARREAIRKDQATRTSLGAAQVSEDLESPAPLLPAEAGAAPSRQQSNLVLMIMVAFVALSCLVGVFGTSRIGDGTDLGKILGGDETTAVATAETPSGSTSGDDKDGGEPLAILNAAGFDPPPGDGVEHNAEVQRVYDGDPSTVWTTEGYNDASFGGVKEGVGIAVDLGQPQEINSVTLALPTDAEATVFAGDQPTNSGTEIGKTGGKTGEVALTAPSPVNAQYVTVWFTSLAPSGEDGRYRAVVGEITVR